MSGFNSGVNEHFSVSFHHEDSHKKFFIGLTSPRCWFVEDSLEEYIISLNVSEHGIRKDHMVLTQKYMFTRRGMVRRRDGTAGRRVNI